MTKLSDKAGGLAAGTYTTTATYDLTTASGTQSITGCPFTPSSVDIIAGIGAQKTLSQGMSDGTVHRCIQYDTGSASMLFRTSFVTRLDTAAGVNQSATATLTSTGCDLSWTKTGSPTGTANLMFRFYR